MKDFHKTMKELGQELKELHIKIDGQKEVPNAHQQVLIDLKKLTGRELTSDIKQIFQN
ncbi:MAG: hypothetical protein ACXAC8_08400 [Candidatus Hodarchaeales archaeon]|jgi:hypothetical protein